MELILKCIGMALCGAVLAVLCKRGGGEFSILVVLAVVTAILVAALTFLKPILTFLGMLQEKAGLGNLVVNPVLKCLGIGLAVEIGSGICEDAGEKGIGTCLQMVGGLAAIYVILPLLENVLSMLGQML